MLDKISELVISKAISKYSGDAYEDIELFESEFNIDYTELNSLCQNLYELGYLSTYCYSSFHNKPVLARLSHKGLHYFEYKRLEWKTYVRNSVIVPIIVTLLTQLLVFLIKSLLKMILG